MSGPRDPVLVVLNLLALAFYGFLALLCVAVVLDLMQGPWKDRPKPWEDWMRGPPIELAPWEGDESPAGQDHFHDGMGDG